MLPLRPVSWLFMSTLIIGTILTVSAPNWITAWMGLELNLMSFIPVLLSNKKDIISSEATLKYFLTQALGSAMLLAGALLYPVLSDIPHTVMFLSLMLKVGAAPFHFWFPPVMQGVAWPQAIMLMTVQKIAPLALMSQLIYSTSDILIFASVLSAGLGAIGGLNQSLLRKLMAYSSINHLAWIMAGLYLSSSLGWSYFMVYSVMSASVAFLLYKTQISQMKQILSLSLNHPINKIAFFVGFFSLGGLPPFLGFLPKLAVISSLVINSLTLWALVLIISSLLTLFFYTRVTVLALTFNSLKVNSPFVQSNKSLMMVLINTVPVVVPAMLLLQF